MFSVLVTLLMISSFNITVIGAYILILTSALSGIAKITLSAFFTFILSVFVLMIADNVRENKKINN